MTKMMLMLTQNQRRESALLLAFAEIGNKHYPPVTRRALQSAADDATAALLGACAQLLGYYLAKLQHTVLTFAESDDPVDINSIHMPDVDAFINSLGAAMTTAATGLGAGPDVRTSQAGPIGLQMDYGSQLVKGLLHNYGAQLNSIIGDGMKQGASREDITKMLLTQGGIDGGLMPEWRARLIAQTEVLRSYNGATYSTMLDAGALYVKWLDGQMGACADCAAMDGAIIPLEGMPHFAAAFRNITAKHPPLHPGCRCSISSAEQDDYINQPNFNGIKYSPSGADGWQTGLPPLVPATVPSPDTFGWNVGLSAKESAIALEKLDALAKDAMISHGAISIGDVGWDKSLYGEYSPNATKEELAKSSVITDVKLSDLHPTQDGVFLKGLKKIIQDGATFGGDEAPLIIRKPDGSLAVGDGHTRLTALKLAGREYATGVRLIDVDALGNLIKKQPVPLAKAPTPTGPEPTIAKKTLEEQVKAALPSTKGDYDAFDKSLDKVAADNGMTQNEMLDKLGARTGKSAMDLWDEKTALLGKGTTPIALSPATEVKALVVKKGVDPQSPAEVYKAVNEVYGQVKAASGIEAAGEWLKSLKTEVGINTASMAIDAAHALVSNWAKAPASPAALTALAELDVYAKAHGYDMQMPSDVGQAINSKQASLSPVESNIWVNKLKVEMGHDASAFISEVAHTISQKILGNTAAKAEPMPQPVGTPAATAFKAWFDAQPEPKPTGIQSAQQYAKATGTAMAATKMALAVEGYEIKHLMAAPAGVVPPPTGTVTVKPPTVGVTAKKVKSDIAKEFTPTFKDVGMVDPKDTAYWEKLNKTGDATGSNPGGFYKGADGQKYYIKKYSNLEQGQTEISSQKIYSMVGVETPSAQMVLIKGEWHYVSKLLPGLKQLDITETVAYMKANPEAAAALHITSAFTQNWDLFGLTNDNLLLNPATGKFVAVDVGGTFKFRAQGKHKDYDPTGLDFHSLMDPSKNTMGSQAFAGLYDNPKAIAAARETIKFLKSSVNYIDMNAAGIGVSRAEMLAKLNGLESKLKAEETRAALGSMKTGGAKEYPHLTPTDTQLFKEGKKNIISRAVGASKVEAKYMASTWSGSSSAETSMVAKARIRSLLTGDDLFTSFVREKQLYLDEAGVLNFDMVDAQRTWERIKDKVSDATMAQIYKENQATIKKAFPSGKITLQRGVNGDTPGGAEAIQRIVDAFAEGRPGIWDPNGIQSFTTNIDTAAMFSGRGAKLSMIITAEMPIESILMDKDWLSAHGGYHSESEYIVIGAPGGYLLTPKTASIWQNGVKIYSEDALPADWNRANADPFIWHLPPDQEDWLPRKAPLPESEQDWSGWEEGS